MNTTRLLLVGAFIISTVVFGKVVSVVSQVDDYIIYDLGTLGGDLGSAHDINNKGQIVGGALDALGNQHAFLWENGEITDLGTLGGSTSQAWGINDNGQISGVSVNTDGTPRACLWENGVITDLGTLGGLSSVAYDINEGGIIVGMSDTITGGQHAFKLENDVMTDLGTLEADSGSQAKGINDNGIIVGYSWSNNLHAFRYENGVMTDLGTLGGSSSIAHGINDSGIIVGEAYIDVANYHGFLWDSGVMSDLGTLGGDYRRSVAYAINNSGQIVGRSFIPGVGNDRAVMWENTVIIDINTLLPPNSGWVLESANGINDQGDIVGSGQINGETHAFLLTSSSNYPTPTFTPTNTPTATSTPTPTYTPTPTATNTPTPTSTVTNTPTLSPTITPSYTPSLTPSKTPTRTPVKLYLALIRHDPSPTPTPTITRTPTPTNTSTLVPSSTPTKTFTPSPTSIPSGVYVLSNHTYYIDSIDSLWIVGEVWNNTSDYLEFVKIPANLYGASGNLLDTDYTYTYLDSLPPGEKTCFDLLFTDYPPEWAYYEFEPPSYWTDGEPLPNLKVYNVSASYDPTYGWYEIIGQVRNDQGTRVEYVSPVGSLYNSTGKVIGCDFTYVNSTHLDPGQTSAFDMLFTGRDYADATNYRIQVDGN